ncbi:SusC/RagA family TonB-linked outer membrane protein [Flexithrix dorotheae]|uniref:SusC/RagA family TonB-linked outer membrane protein n=1 Tax=Flexithrix dorotheae TaxID=70993 RepID=UPI00039DD74D|nr:TonB-dependent receptor [Flexithrix dorotheae]
MKLKIIQQILAMSKYVIIGIFIQALLCDMLLAEESKAQSMKKLEDITVSIASPKKTLKEVFIEIENKTKFVFTYSDFIVNEKEEVTIIEGQDNLYEILYNISKNTGLRFKRIDDNIFVTQKSFMGERIEQEINENNSSQIKVSGIITSSEDNEPLPGVSIIIKGTTVGTTTDLDGKYTLNTTSDDVLQFSYIGFIIQEITVGNQNIINIALQPDLEQLEEVVVVGYSTQKKTTLTGAVSVVKSDDIVRTKNENVLNSLTGKLPGVRIVQKSSAPGAYDTRIDIRGMGDPLFVIDGIVRDQDYFARMSAEEIESVSVLKDGSAAIYGLRAANGVVLVTTKSGVMQDGKVDVTFNTSVSMQQFLYVPESVGAIDYMTLSNEKNWQDFGKNYLVRTNPLFTEDHFEPYYNGTKQSYNWFDQVFNKTSPQFNNNLSVNGGSEKLRYYFTLGYNKQIGAYKSGDYYSTRWNMRTNIESQITKRLSAKVSLGAIMVKNSQPNGTGWTTYKLTWLTRPDAAFYANDNPEYPNGDNQYLNEGANMIVQTDDDYVGYNLSNDRRYNGTLTLNYDIPGIEGLSAKGVYDYATNLPDYTNYKRAYTLFRYNPDDDSYSSIERNTPSDITRSVGMSYSTNMQLGLHYDNKLGNHNVSSFFIYEDRYNTWDSYNAYRELLVDSEYLFAGEDENQRATEGEIADRASKSLIGQLNYNFMGKYLLDLRFRYDGSSRFPEGSRFGFFPSVSAGWRLSEENFIINNLPIFSNLKIRGSYGEMGDDSSAGNYPPTTGYSLDGNNYGWFYGGTLTGGVTASSIPNPNLTWYKIKSYDLGIDFGLLSNKLTGTFDIYRRDRSGLLATSAAVIPGTVGASLPQENLNSDRNFGYEISLRYANKFRDFNYYVSGQLSATKSMRTDWLETPAGNSYDRWRNRTSGRYNDIWWGNESQAMIANYADIQNYGVPLPQNTLPGDWVLNDWNEDGVINANDEHPIASYGLPVFNYGISLGASGKGFDLALDFQGAYGVYVQYAEVLTEALPFGGQNTLTWFMDRWRPADPNADYFNPNTEWISGYYPVTGHDGRRTGTNGIQNASYIRLKTAELGYTLPEKWVSKINLRNLRIYLSGYNLLTFTGLENVDPERPGASGGSSTNYIDFYNYPVNRTYTVGASIKF